MTRRMTPAASRGEIGGQRPGAREHDERLDDLCIGDQDVRLAGHFHDSAGKLLDLVSVGHVGAERAERGGQSGGMDPCFHERFRPDVDGRDPRSSAEHLEGHLPAGPVARSGDHDRPVSHPHAGSSCKVRAREA